MCLCFCFVWACGFCPSFLCATCSCQFVLTPPILLPVYWFIFPSCFPSLPSSFAPFIISLCLQFRVGSYLMFDVVCVLSSPVLPCPALPCPALPCLLASPFVFPLRGSFCLFVYFYFLLNKLSITCIWVFALFHSPNSWQFYITIILFSNITGFISNTHYTQYTHFLY